MILKFLLSVFFTSVAFALTSQSVHTFANPDTFQGFLLGTAHADLTSKGILNTHYDYMAPYSTVVTKGLVSYTLKKRVTEANDKIEIDLFFYHDSLSVIRVRYEEPQSCELLLNDLRSKYGKEYAFDEGVYNDQKTGISKVIKNYYWGGDCFLNLSASDEFGIVCLTFAEKQIQTKLKNQQIKLNDKKID